MRIALVTALVLALFIACQPGEQAPQKDETPLVYDIGVISREISTDSADAQLWFDRGLGLAYGFNHEEAIVCFEQAIEADPNCAICYWGKAYALGPNYNNVEMEAEASEAAYQAAQRAVELLEHASEAEAALIEAVAARYAWPVPESRAPLEAAYAEGMRSAYALFPDDADVAALTAEAVMMLRPWQLWSAEGEAAPETAEIRAILEPALERWPQHPALGHLYIHTMEAGPEMRKATAAAEAMEPLTPGLGHLIHMPSHIYMWSGRYDDSIRVNQKAIEVDRAFVEHAGRLNFYTLYRLHNYHFVAYGGMFTGQKKLAIDASRELVSELPAELMQQFPDFLDIFVATPFHVMVRFGMWEEILDEPEFPEVNYAANAVRLYARGLALATLGRTDEALAEQQAFEAARAAVPETRLLFNNAVADILGVASAVLDGEVQYRLGNYDAAFSKLRTAVELDQQLNYDEPWGWMEPARHALGALLTEQKRYDEAIEVYEANLARFPENGWALHGLAECLRGLGKEDEAAAVQARFDAAWTQADVTIPGSCFCKGAGA